MKRRDFLSGLALTSASLAAANGVGKTNGNSSPIEQAATPQASGRKNVIVCAANGYQYIDDGYQLLSQGADTLDAAIKVISGPENDPNDDSVGLGGLPNEDGVVELDACCMHGPTRRAGSVGRFSLGKPSAKPKRAAPSATSITWPVCSITPLESAATFLISP